MRPRIKGLLRWLVRATFAALAVVVAVVVAAAAFVWFWLPFPFDEFERWPVSPRVTDRDGNVLLQIVGDDGQWRYPVSRDAMSEWIVKATIAAEDERFVSHNGVDAVALLRAVFQNVDSGRVVSGASTLTMQLCRMADDQPRTLASKFVEAIRALQVERRFSKPEIIEQYLNVAPYGGNVRGVEAASLKFFGKPASDLSLGEAALLAGLPQSPTRFRPDRFPEAAARRRHYVLKRLRETGVISIAQEQLAATESVESLLAAGDRGARSRMSAQHAAWMALQQRPGGGRTTIDGRLQALAESLTAERLKSLPDGTDAAIVVIEVASSEIVALVGSGDPNDPIDGQVNGVLARRSPGSALKPFLYAAAFEARRLNGESLVEDRPIERAGWRPDNFDRSFRGTMRVADALRESRNVPAILVTEEIGVARCVGLLEAAGVSLGRDARQRGGLAIAVGAVETTLLDLTNAYATLGRGGVCTTPQLFAADAAPRLRSPVFPEPDSTVSDVGLGEVEASRPLLGGPLAIGTAASPDARTRPDSRAEGISATQGSGTAALSPAVSSVLSDILSTRHRVPRGLEETPADRIPWFMWKTGTSSGRRDAWAVGHNGRFAVGIWLGNFSGAGHTAFVGAEAAEPLLAAIFCNASVRTDRIPAEPEPLLVTLPLNLSPQSRRGPDIVSPSDRVVLVCQSGDAVQIPVSAANADDVVWFLNRKPLETERLARLTLPRGAYELRCVDPAGRFDAVQFTVEQVPSRINFRGDSAK